LFELAQLIEDYPLLEPVDENWQSRMDFCDEYLATLRRLTEVSWNGPIRETYSAFMLYRALFGLARIELKTRRGRLVESSSALRSATAREQHYRQIVKFLADEGPTEKIRRCANLIQETLKQLLGA
jgi:hypothetical protein